MVYELRRIAGAWDDAQDAVARGASAPEGGRSASGVHPPAPVDLGVVDACRDAQAAVTAVAVAVVDVDAGVRWPSDASTPGLASWAAGRVSVVACWPDSGQVLSWYGQVQGAADALSKAADQGAAEVFAPEPCQAWLLDEYGERTGRRCQGQVVLREGGGAVCSINPLHWVSAEVWMKAQRAARPQKRGARPPRVAASQ
ncbi:MAG: hypothetical protein ACTMIK_12360 [Galactobacter sp.]